MKKVMLTLGFTLAGIFSSLAQAQVIALTIDPAQSSVDVALDGSASDSQLSGTSTIDIQSLNPPSGSAQITELDIVADEGLSFSFALGLVSVSSSPGDVSFSLVTPGAPGTITDGSFDQLANTIEMAGDFNVSDPLGFVGGSQTVDLSTITLSPQDATSISVTQSGDTITVSSSFTIVETTDFGLLEVDVTYVATGTAPEAVLGDVNRDGFVTFLDIGPFITILSGADFQLEADCNEDGVVNFLDISPFIALLAGP